MSHALGNDAGTGGHTILRRFGPSLIVLLVSVATALLLVRLYDEARHARAREHFDSWCEERQQGLSRSIDAHVEAIYALRALFDSSLFVTGEEFAQYSTQLIARNPTMRATGYMRHVTLDGRETIEKGFTRILGRPFAILEQSAGGQLVPAGNRAVYAPLVYVRGSNESLVGFDMRSVAGLASALDRSVATGSASASISEVEGQWQGHPARVVRILLPIYTRATIDAELPAREVDGALLLRFTLDEVAESVAEEARNMGIDMRLVVQGPNAPAADVGEGEIVTPASWLDRESLEWRGGIQIADRAVSLQFRATDQYVMDRPVITGRTALLIGLAGSLAAALTTWFLTRSRLRNERMSKNLAAEMRERRLSEQRTAESEERYRVLIENSPDAILMIRGDRVTFVNRAAVDMFGAKSPEELIGRSPVDRVHPDFRAIAAHRVERMLRDKIILPPLEEKLYRLDDSVIDVEVRSVPFTIGDDTVLQVTMRDISARKQAERERLSLEAALRQSQRLEAVGTLAGGIAHDFNNILSAIVGNIHLVMDDLPKGHPARRSAHEIRSATARARDLVKRLMTFSRQQETPMSAVNLADLVEEVQQLLRPALPAGVVMHSFVPPDTPPVIADATQLHQLLVNLCTNAWQAMTSGRGEIRITVATLLAEEARSEAATTLEGAARYVRIEIRDNGSGIPADIRDRIFDPFFTTKAAGEGSGLGLAVVHGIVRSHHGAITVKSEPGAGSTFCVYLRASEEPAAVPVTPVEVCSRGANQHVLYIDDEEPLVELVTRILERSGYQCTASTDPRAAMDLLDKDPRSFDLVLTDMNMPRMSGLDVAREVLSRYPSLPVVITTGYVRAADVSAAQALGVRDLVLKPDTIDELALLVASYLPKPATG